MKILQVIPCYYPAHRYGGPIKSVHELNRKLVDLGADITVFTTNADGSKNLNIPILKEVNIEGIKVFYFPVKKPRGYFRSPLLCQELKKRLRAFDIVHINWLYVYPTMVAARECFRQKVPYILSPRGMLDPNAMAMKGRIKKLLYINFIEKGHISNAAAIHFTSVNEKHQASSFCRNVKTRVVPNGIHLSEYENLPPRDILLERFPEISSKKIVLFLGRLNYIKGLDLLSRAWPMVVKDIPDAHLVLVGPDDGHYSKKVRYWLSKEHIKNSITFTGMLLGEEKRSALHSSHVLVAPSYLESFGMAIVEAMACYKPVIITNRVNIYEEIEEAKAGLITSCDPSKIAEAIIYVLKNDANGNEMGQKGRKLVEDQFTSERTAEQMLQLYEDILINNGD